MTFLSFTGLVGFGVCDTCVEAWGSAGPTGPPIQSIIVFTLLMYTTHILWFQITLCNAMTLMSVFISGMKLVNFNLIFGKEHPLIGAAHTPFILVMIVNTILFMLAATKVNYCLMGVSSYVSQYVLNDFRNIQWCPCSPSGVRTLFNP